MIETVKPDRELVRSWLLARRMVLLKDRQVSFVFGRLCAVQVYSDTQIIREMIYCMVRNLRDLDRNTPDIRFQNKDEFLIHLILPDVLVWTLYEIRLFSDQLQVFQVPT